MPIFFLFVLFSEANAGFTGETFVERTVKINKY